MAEKPNFYAIIPANVRYDNRLKDKAKLLYGEITALCSAKGYCYASNAYFASLYGVTKETISRLIKDLSDNGHVSLRQVFNGKEIIERRIYICDEKSIPIDQNVNTPIDEIINTPIDEKVKENNTSIINTSIINTSKGGVDIFGGYNFSPAMQAKLTDWLLYKKERKESYKPTGLTAFLSGVKNRLEKHEEADIIALIDDCMANNWKGIIWDKLPPPKPKVHIMPKQETEPQTLEEIFGVEYD